MQMIQSLLTSTHLLVFKDGKTLRYANPTKIRLFNSTYIQDVISGEKAPFDISKLKEELDFNFSLSKGNRFFLCFYELGHLFNGVELKDHQDLCLSIEFDAVEELPEVFKANELEIKILSDEKFDTYKSNFESTKEHLINGDCYQLNLTNRSTYKVENSLEELYLKFLQISKSEFAHTLYIKELNKLILSNTPECLFEYKDELLWTRPIKGTVKESEGEKALADSLKNESELNIITDLLRNDFSSIGKYFSKVIERKKLFKVPGLIHQCSVLNVELERDTSLFQILKSVFPGGSITGAPKKRVLKLIESIEKTPRRVYTGSSILITDKVKSSSINIRTIDLDTKTMTFTYGSGGGITLDSELNSEYDELLSKRDSFIGQLVTS